ncbi:hypothetical protein AVEN_12319-1 [Araneus ventricosus]|uniref:Uncharacterized protein n=1 Tax=Araneus ventricosus TaxID=182803 RepID=A0A4Y2EAL3_ARAVE|nr:hypothetical protein AVEN_12319-1 [Araneus ventricosus]
MSMTVAFKYRRTKKSLSLSSTTKTIAMTRKSPATTTVLRKGHPMRNLFTAMTWLEQLDCVAVQLLSLKRVRDLAAKKSEAKENLGLL